MIIIRNILTFTLLLAKLFSIYGQTSEKYINKLRDACSDLV